MAITKVTSSVLSSGSATDGYVLTADGSGNSAWEAAAGGGVAGIVSTADATAITIDSSENVGIGTASPDSKLHVSATTPIINLQDSNGSGNAATPYLQYKDSGGTDLGYVGYGSSGNSILSIVNIANDSIDFLTNGTQRMRIDSAGNLLLGTTSHSTGAFGAATGINVKKPRPQVLLQDTTNNTDAYFGLTTGAVFLATQDNLNIQFYTNDLERMRIDSAGNIGAPTGTNIYNASDERLKQNISTLSNSLDVINALNPVQFNWIDNFEESENGKNLYGFVAQEVQDVFPDAVESFGTGNAIEVDGTVIENPLTVRDKFFIPVLVKAIQEQQALIESLEARITALES